MRIFSSWVSVSITVVEDPHMTKMQSRSFDSLSKDFWITDGISLHTDLLRHSSILLFVKI